jgi:glycosyltransferase involved in cell wall biosynthesis
LRQNGWEIDFSYLLNAQDDKVFYAPGKLGAKAIILGKSIAKRIGNLLHKPNYDVVFVQREAFMLGTALFERLLKRTGAKLIFDFDDAIWLQFVSSGNQKLGFLKNAAKTNELIAMADMVFAGNQYLAEHAQKFTNPANIHIIPTTIDTQEYQPIQNSEKTNSICIGWSGSVSTIEHFKTILPVLHQLKQQYGDKLSFKVIGDGQYVNSDLGIQGLPWIKEREVPEISSFDIGIMPLPDDEWAKGKCGLKGLQYMSLQVPTVMSPVGVNSEIIQNGVNGMLATTEEEWLKAITQLIEAPELRRKIGQASRQTVLEKYSVEAWKNFYLAKFDALCKN